MPGCENVASGVTLDGLWRPGGYPSPDIVTPLPTGVTVYVVKLERLAFPSLAGPFL